MDPTIVALIGIALLFVFLSIKMPIWASLGLSGSIGITILRGWAAVGNTLSSGPWGSVSSYVLSAIPLFLLMGSFASYSGITKDAFEATYKWLGRLRGGLAMATVAASGIFAATSGSSVATAAMMGKVVFPEMKRFNYDLKLGAGAIASGGLLGIMIPPSIIFILYASMAQISVADQLLAGVFPGLLTILVFCFGISVICIVNPNAGPSAPPASFKESIIALKKLWGALILILIVIGGIYGGIFTPTEAAAIGAFFAFIFMVTIGKRQGLNVKESVKISALSMASTTSMIFALLVGAGIFSVFLSLARVPQLLSRTILDTGLPPSVIVILFLSIYIPIGMFLDTISALIVTVPIVIPVIRTLGIDLTWFGVLVCLMIEIALLTPPVGMNVYMVKATAPKELSLSDVYNSIIPFLIMLFVVLTILIIFPSISLWLPMHSRGGV